MWLLLYIELGRLISRDAVPLSGYNGPMGQPTGVHLIIEVSSQRAHLYAKDTPLASYRISTGKNGVGEQRDSEQTPRGRHRIRAKIGAGAAPNTVFRGRRANGELCTPELYRTQPERDWILTRILWLCGEELGKNRLGRVDTMQRFVYIHGSPDWVPMGVPGSRGCVRMHNGDVIELFDRVQVGTPVLIVE